MSEQPGIKINAETYRAVAMGANFLDRHVEVVGGDWRKRINADTLNVGDCNVCVIGQLFNDDFKNFQNDEGFFYGDPYEFGIDELGIANGSPYGFDRGMSSSYTFIELTAAWIEELS